MKVLNFVICQWNCHGCKTMTLTFIQVKNPSNHLLVFKTSWSRLQGMPWICLQHVSNFEDVLDHKNFLRWRRLEGVLKTYLEDVLKICLEDVSKKWLEDVLKASWRQRKWLLGTSICNHSLLTNLNQYLTNLYLANFYFTNLRRIQNALTRTK